MKTPTAHKKRSAPRVMACAVRSATPRIPKASLDALREARDMIASPEKYPAPMSLGEFFRWSDSVVAGRR